MDKLPPAVQRGLNIYLAYLQRAQAQGAEFEQLGREMIRLSENIERISSQPDFDPKWWARLLKLTNDQYEVFMVNTKQFREWVEGIHAIH